MAWAGPYWVRDEDRGHAAMPSASDVARNPSLAVHNLPDPSYVPPEMRAAAPSTAEPVRISRDEREALIANIERQLNTDRRAYEKDEGGQMLYRALIDSRLREG